MAKSACTYCYARAQYSSVHDLAYEYFGDLAIPRSLHL